ncbi:MAG: Lrp/AsnC family transcriptional regulator [Chloroflexia bacterium]|nr:Lrp/AsnC family transcriptional regulator [Chloroflexia bacterium]MDQ3413024.1 Lrp/AsnC family transcriptional regulator [Chloroflexota bacterium]
MTQTLTNERLFAYSPPIGLLDAINRRLLEALRDNPRLPMTALARRVGMSSPAVTERVRRLEEAGVIRGYRLDLDPAALGLPLTAYIRIRPNAGRLAAVAALAEAIPEIVECHRITGDDCFILKVHLPSMDQLDRILDRFLAHGVTTTSMVQSSPVPLRPLPVPEP